MMVSSRRTLLHQRSGKRGEKHPNHKLTEAKVIEMRALYDTGKWKISELAIKYSISRSAAHGIVHGYTWKIV